MLLSFNAKCPPTAEDIAAVALATPHTPFNTPEYAAARSALGEAPCVLSLMVDRTITAGCVAFMKKGIMARQLEIATAPQVQDSPLFWTGVLDFCRSERISDLVVGTFASESGPVPALPGELQRRPRCEFVMDLQNPDYLRHLSKGHRYDIKRAKKAALVVQRTRDPKATSAHLEVMKASMQRRRNRGEEVSSPEGMQLFEALLIHKAAELFQLREREEVVASMLIVSSKSSAYYHTGGTSPAGMNKGAASFLTTEVARVLQGEGVRLFNLGGADFDNQGLYRFKAGFGARKVLLEAVSLSTVSPVTRKLRTAVRFLFSEPLRYARSLY